MRNGGKEEERKEGKKKTGKVVKRKEVGNYNCYVELPFNITSKNGLFAYLFLLF